MKRLKRIFVFIFYPTFYFGCLALFGYLTFPLDALKGRILAEFDRQQAIVARRSMSDPMHLEIKRLDTYWFTGVEITDAILTIPPKKPRRYGRGAAAALAGSDKPPQPSRIIIDGARVRLKLLPLLAGKVRFSLDADALGGHVEGELPWGTNSGAVEVALEGIQLGQVAPLKSMLQGLPVFGKVSGNIELQPVGGKFAKSEGKVDIRIDRMILGDGKAKAMGVALPAAQIGNLTVVAPVKGGVVTLEELLANGKHLILQGDGTIRLNETWDRSNANIGLKFKFTDAYRTSSEATIGLLGKPGDKIPPLIELDPKKTFKRAKCDDGFYCFSLSGKLNNLDAKPGKRGAARGRRPRAGASRGRRPRGRKLGAGSRKPLGRPPTTPATPGPGKRGEGDEGAGKKRDVIDPP